MEAALFSEEGEQALVDIDETDVVASFVVDQQLFQLAFGDADAGVVDIDLEIVLVLDEAGLDAAALSGWRRSGGTWISSSLSLGKS